MARAVESPRTGLEEGKKVAKMENCEGIAVENRWTIFLLDFSNVSYDKETWNNFERLRDCLIKRREKRGFTDGSSLLAQAGQCVQEPVRDTPFCRGILSNISLCI